MLKAYTSFPAGSDGKASACNVGDLGSIPALGRSPGEGNSNPLKYPCMENFHGQRSLVGYSPWSHRESDTTERLTLSLSGLARFVCVALGKLLSQCFSFCVC